jgi:hypothetical protein
MPHSAPAQIASVQSLSVHGVHVKFSQFLLLQASSELHGFPSGSA